MTYQHKRASSLAIQCAAIYMALPWLGRGTSKPPSDTGRRLWRSAPGATAAFPGVFSKESNAAGTALVDKLDYLAHDGWGRDPRR